MIAGGSKLPKSILTKFVALAGGPGEARIVVIPTASMYADDPEWVEGRLETWRELGAASVRQLHTRESARANDPGFAAPLLEATGVWIGGGDQSRLTTTYGDTLVLAELRRVFERGGVIGGTSAGAAVMSNPMIVGGNPVARTGLGFGFLEGVVVDQHFVARRRIDRLRGVLADRKDLAGLGIDEGTAVVVCSASISVVGDSTATAIWPQAAAQPGREQVLSEGDALDLVDLLPAGGE